MCCAAAIFKYLICDNSLILITSHSANTTLECGDGDVSTMTGCWLNGPEFKFCQDNRCYLARIYPDHGWDTPSQLFSGYNGSFLVGCSNCAVYLPTHLHLASRWMSEAILLVPLNVFMEWTGTDLPFLHFQGSGKFKRPPVLAFSIYSPTPFSVEWIITK